MPSENTMASFRNIDELIRTLDREKILLKEMFEKRKALSYRQEDALSLLDYKLERLKFLVESGVILSNDDFMELEEVHIYLSLICPILRTSGQKWKLLKYSDAKLVIKCIETIN